MQVSGGCRLKDLPGQPRGFAYASGSRSEYDDIQLGFKRDYKARIILQSSVQIQSCCAGGFKTLREFSVFLEWQEFLRCPEGDGCGSGA
jgi:hypothetical protein